MPSFIYSLSVTVKGLDIWKLIGLEAVAPPLLHGDGKAPGEGVEPSQAAKIKTPCLWGMGLTSLTGVSLQHRPQTHPPPHHTSSTWSLLPNHSIQHTCQGPASVTQCLDFASLLLLI